MARTIKSQISVMYWIHDMFAYSGAVFFIGFCAHHSIEKGVVNYSGIPFWAGCLAAVLFVALFYRFLFFQLKTITVSEKGIDVKYFVSGITKHIDYTDIIKMKSQKLRSSQGAGMTQGYHRSVLHLRNGDKLMFSQFQFSNYYKVRSLIHLYKGQ